MKQSLQGTQPSRNRLLKVATAAASHLSAWDLWGAERERLSTDPTGIPGRSTPHVTSLQQAAILAAQSPSQASCLHVYALSCPHPLLLCAWYPCPQRPQAQVTSPLAPSHSQAQMLWRLGAC